MALQLYAHPFSSYCQKVLTALYENGTPFELRVLAPDNPKAAEEFASLWPLKRMPLLRDGERSVVESSIIIAYLDLHHPGPARLIPAGGDAALDVHMMDRFFDLYVHAPMQKVVGDRLRAEADRDPFGVAEARSMLDTAYAWLDRQLRGNGPPATISASPIALPHRPCSMPTGRIPFRPHMRTSRLTGNAF